MKAPRRRRIGEHVPTLEGRELLVRPLLFGDGVQLAIVGKRGAIVESSSVGLAEVPGLIFAVDGISEIAWAQHNKQLQLSRRTREQRHADALARNPWLQGKRPTKEVYV